MNVPEQFSIMHNSTLCLNEAQRAAVFNGLCHTLHEQWSIPHEMLSKQMDEYGYEYLIECPGCGTTEKPWYEKCSECNST